MQRLRKTSDLPARRRSRLNERCLAAEVLEVRAMLSVTPPVVIAQSYPVFENVPLSQAAPGLLSGATAQNGDPLTASLVSPAQHGTVTVNANGSFTYTATANYVGTDSFTYEALDGTVASNIGTVTLNVNAVTQAPTATGANWSLLENSSVTVTSAPRQSVTTVAQTFNSVVYDSANGLLYADTSTSIVPINPISGALGTPVPISGTPGQMVISTDGQYIYMVVDGGGAVQRFNTITQQADNFFALPSGISVGTISAIPGQPTEVLISGHFNGFSPPEAATVVYQNGVALPSTVGNNSLGLGGPDQSFVDPNGTNAFGYVSSLSSFTFSFLSIDSTGVHQTSTASVLSGNIGHLSELGGNLYTGSGSVVSLTTDQQVATFQAGYDYTLDNADGKLLSVASTGGTTQQVYVYSLGSMQQLATFTLNNVPSGDSGAHGITQIGNNGLAFLNGLSQVVIVSSDLISGDPYRGVLANDTDPNQLPLTAQLVTGVQHGTLSLNSDGTFTYTPNPGFFGTDSFTYTANNGTLNSTPATVTFTVQGFPTAVAQSYTANENAVNSVAANVGVLTGDTDPNGLSLSAQVATGPSHGTLTLNADGSFTYTPTVNYFGPDSFTYTVTDGVATSAAVKVTLTVNYVPPAPPVVQAQAYSLNENLPLSLAAPGLLSGATSQNGDLMTAALVTPPQHGTVTVGSNGSLNYAPAANYVGTDTFTYEALDGTVASNPATVTLTVNAVTQPPIATNGSWSIATNGQLTVTSAPRQSVTTVAQTFNSLVYDPANGLVYGDNSTSIVAINPATGVVGTAVPISGTPQKMVISSNGQYIYAVVDSGGAVQRFNTVTQQADQFFALPSGIDVGTISAIPGQPLSVLISGTIPGVSPPTAATAIYQNGVALPNQVGHNEAGLGGPTQTFVSPDGTTAYGYDSSDTSFGFNIMAISSTGVVQTGTASPLSGFNVGNLSEYGGMIFDSLGQVVSLATDKQVATFLGGGDYTIDATTGNLYSTVSSGTGTQTIYVYSLSTLQQVSSFTLGNIPNGSSSAKDTVRFGTNGMAFLNGNSQLVLVTSDLISGDPYRGVLANDTDPNGLPITAQLVTNVQHGSLTLNSDGTFSYTPSPGFSGTDSFTYMANNGTLNSSPATVTLSVVGVPVAKAASYGVNENTPVSYPASLGVLSTDTDPNGLTLTAQLATGPAHGTLTLNPDGSFTYTPTANYVGTDSFTYTATDGLATSTAAKVSLNVVAIPIAKNDAYSFTPGTLTTITATNGVLANDTSVNAQPLTAQLVATTSHGTLSLNSNGSFTYQPSAGFVGTDSFTYEDVEGGLTSNVATVTLTGVLPPPPVAVADSAVVHPGQSAAINVLQNDAAGSGATLDPTSVTILTQPTHGTAVVNPQTGVITYTSTSGYLGPDSFSYVVKDNFGSLSNPATVSISVTDTPPTAAAHTYLVAENGSLIVSTPGLLTGAASATGSVLTASLVNSPGNGTVNVNPDGSFTYTPAANYQGSDSFTFEVSDGTLTSSPATVTLTVVSYQQPTTRASAFSLSENGVLEVPAPGILVGAADPNGLSLSAVLQSGPADGQLSLGTDGSLIYTPAANFVGQDSFTFAATDGPTSSSATTVTMTVLPVAESESYHYTAGTLLTVPAAAGVLSSNPNAAGQAFTAALVNSTTNGTLTFNADGSFSYQPDAGFSGKDSFTYQVSDGLLTSSQAVVTLSVSPQLPPVAQNLMVTTAENKPTTVYELQGDVAGAGATLDPTSVTILTPPVHGTATVDSQTGAITYQSNTGFVGTDSLVYTVKDNLGNVSNPATVSFTIVSSSVWQNPVNPLDVQGDGGPVVPADALLVIDYLNQHPVGTSLPSTLAAGSGFLDVLGTGTVVPADALAIINYLNLNPTSAPSPAVAGANSTGVVPAAMPSAAVAMTPEPPTPSVIAAPPPPSDIAAPPPPSVVGAGTTDLAVSSALPSDASSVTPAFIAATQVSSSTAASGASSTYPPASDGASGNSIQPLVKPIFPSNTSPAKGNTSAGAVDAVLADPLSNWLDD